MVRSVVTVLALAILPGFEDAQQPAETASHTHQVVAGETLWAPAFNLQPGQYPDVVSDRTEATSLEFGGSYALNSLGDVAILDRGGEQGVAIGDEYVAFQGDGPPEDVVGRLRVVTTDSQTASARIVSVEGPVFKTGIAVHLDRKMR